MIEAILSQTRRGEVITFYSFKGGVGRTMALANIAAIYAQRGKRVLALDFDFEAPGLHRYFLTNEEERYTPTGQQKGVLNFFDALRAWLCATFPDGQDFQGVDTQDKLRAFIGEQLDSGKYLYQVRLKNPNAKGTPVVQIDFIAAALFDTTYSELVRTFDWQGFYDKYADVFPAIVKALTSRYDVVLVDSRTGVTDIGSICTMVLPDKLVLVFAPNEQSLSGALDAGWQAVQGRKAAPEPKVLPIFPLVSRVEEGEEQQKREWLARVRRSFEKLLSAAYDRTHVDLEAYFNIVRIPHKSYFAYGEHIAATEQAANEFGSMAQAVQRLADALECDGAPEAQHVLSPRVVNEGISALLEGADIADNDGQFPEVVPLAVHLMVRNTMAQALLLRRQANEAIRLFDTIIRKAQDVSEPEVKEAFVASLLGKAAALSQLGRVTDALNIAHDALTHSENVDDSGVRDNATRSALLILGNSFVRVAKEALQSDEESKALAILEKAESKLSPWRQRLPQNAWLFGHSAYVAFLAGRQDESRALLTRAVELGGAKLRESLLKLVATHPLPQDNEFRAFLASIPDPPGGSASSA
jgi:MinD-like ATPase involved in chromosome partitioning or flagellar assembly